MNNNLFKSFEDTKVGEEYLTTPYDYSLNSSGFYENIKNKFLPATTLLELQKTLPIYANTLIELLTVPVKIIDDNGKKLISIEPEYISQIKKNTSKDIGELLSGIPTNIDILKGDIYKFIEDLNQYFIDEDESIKEKMSIKINTLYNNIDKILEKDISNQYNSYKDQFDKELSDGDIFEENPIEEQIEKAKLLLINFMKSFPKENIISMTIEDGSGMLFNIINTVQQYLSEKYNLNTQQNNSDEEIIKSSIQNSINDLNSIFTSPEEDKKKENIINIDERIITLSENIFGYLGSLRLQPETSNDSFTIKEKIDGFFTKFCKDTYGEQNALQKGLSLGEDFSYIQRLIEDFLNIKEYPYENINPDTTLGMCISILDYHEKGKEKKLLKTLEEIKTHCTIKDITKELYQKDIIILKEIAQQYEIYEFSAILKKIEPKI